MEATKGAWEVNISFFVDAIDDEDALDVLRDFILPAPDHIVWVWQSSKEVELWGSHD